MNFFFEFLLPPVVDSTIPGIKLPVYLFMLIAILSTVRSCIHLLAPDGGASSIAGLDLSVDGAPGIIFSFALWGRQCTTNLLVRPVGRRVPLLVARAFHVCTAVLRSDAAHAGGTHETGDLLAHASGRVCELRGTARGCA